MIDKELVLYCLKSQIEMTKEVCEECDCYKECTHSFQDKVFAEAVKLIEQPKVNEWIPVTERLPEELKPVLVAYRGYHDNKIYCDNVAYIRADDWVWNCDESEVIVEIVAWQSLPKPYEVKENVD